ncbi:MAG: hypothetical protein LLF76_07695 [Planctomycetaceae bacterium]|nr:hypothetical protein [Planctomycetaceae bacterium]
MNGTYVDLLSRLRRGEVDFVLIGGFACIVQGASQSTIDVDVCCDFTPRNLLRLQKAISDLHPVHRMTPRRLPLELTEENATAFKNLYLDTDLGQLDCIGYVQGLGDYRAIEPLCEIIELEGMRIRVLNRDALITSKKAMNRDKDQQTIRELEGIKNIERRGS